MQDARSTRWGGLWALVFISGASGLVYEILWIRALGRSFGTTAPALSTVLAAFMGGLALGSMLFGARADRSRDVLGLYRRIELGIALSGLAVSLLLLRGDPFLTLLARATGHAGAASDVLRFAIFGLLLLVPTTLMGATLPVLARAVAAKGVTGRALGQLYALNTAGAVVGALAPDLALIPWVGLTATAALAAAGNLYVAFAIGRLQSRSAVAEAGAESHGMVRAWPPVRATLLFASSGFCAMGIQVLWSRILEHWTANLAACFALLLAVFLVCIAAGSWLARRVADRAGQPLFWAATLLCASGVAVLAPLAFAPSWIRLQDTLMPTLQPLLRPSIQFILADALMHALYLEAVACLLMGAAFPFLAAASVQPGAAGQHTARLYAVNTAAGVLGAIAAGFLVLPHLGLQRGFASFALLATLAGAVIASLEAGPRRRLLASSLVGPLLALAIVLLQAPDALVRSQFSRERGRIVAIREGPVTSAAVLERSWFGEPAFLELMTPSVSMSDTRLTSSRYMKLMGHLGVFLAEQPTRALLICYGVGNTAVALLSHPDLERLDVVDISDEVLSMSPLFAREHGFDPLTDPRIAVHRDDGRHHLVKSDALYDVITAEPPPPINTGVVNLYSREYYRLARKRLKPGGVMTQWLPIFQLSKSETLSAIAAFTTEFPHVALFYGYGYQWILAGSERPLSIDLDAWDRRAGAPSVAADLRGVGVDGVGDLVATFLADEQRLQAVSAAVAPLTDDHPTLEYPMGALLRVEIPEGLLGNPADVASLIAPAQRERLNAYRAHLDTLRHVLTALPLMSVRLPELREMTFGSGVRLALGERTSHQATRALIGLDERHIALARAAIADPQQRTAFELAEARRTLLRLAFYDGRYEELLADLRALDPREIGEALYHLLEGGAQRALARPELASAAFLRAALASRSSEFRERAQQLARQSADAYPPELGPLALRRTAVTSTAPDRFASGTR